MKYVLISIDDYVKLLTPFTDEIIEVYSEDIVNWNNYSVYEVGYDRAYMMLNMARNTLHTHIIDGNGYERVRFRIDPTLEPGHFVKDINGNQAQKYMLKVLEKHYTDEEIREVLKNHSITDGESQLHHINKRPEQILQFNNCVYQDINNAHGSALMIMFPKCKKEILNMYQHRKDNDGFNKKVFNYFVGMLNSTKAHNTLIFPGAYKWIVNHTTEQLVSLYQTEGGIPVYINTDGIILQEPRTTIPDSDKMGEFKKKNCIVYTYEHLGNKEDTSYNYVEIHYTDGTIETKSLMPYSLRKYMNLADGKVIRYKKIVNKNTVKYELLEEKQ